MTNRRKSKRTRRSAPPRRSRLPIAAGALAVLAAGVALVAVVAGGGPTAEPAGLVRTGEVNEMGLPVVRTPGRAAGVASAGGVEVTGANWEMGRVPLEVAVRPSWTLVNVSAATVSLGEPHPEVRAGCCPGPFTFGQRTLRPGESTTLTFELSMHPGMDGWHDIAVHVPVSGDGGTRDVLELAVTGDFRGAFEG
ncbi:MAG TPA: hypothetical protein VF029_02950 [Actinomycetota bacterium]